MYDAHTNEFANAGYTIVRGLFTPDEVAQMQAHYMQLNVEKRAKAEVNGVKDEHDPLKRFPRMLQMHRWDEVSLRFLLDSRLKEAMTVILGSEPYAVQSMIYFKPPTARAKPCTKTSTTCGSSRVPVLALASTRRLRRRKRLSASRPRQSQSAGTVYDCG